jgi:hypothetical protein
MDIEQLRAISEIVGGLSMQAILLYWVFVERKRADTAWQAIQEDWQRQREREIDRKLANGSGL